MDTRKPDRENVYDAAEAWVDRALRSDDSLFTPGRPIWTTQWLDELRDRFLDQPDVGGDDHLQKLERQLREAPPQAYQLMAEVTYVHLLVPSNMGGPRKREQVKQILGWSPEVVDVSPKLLATLDKGLAHIGKGLNNRPDYLGCIIEFAMALKRLSHDDRLHLLDDAWDFKAFLMDLSFESKIFFGTRTAHLQRLALMHLVHPGTFEPIVSADHKQKIAAALKGRVKHPDEDVDRELLQIRAAMETDGGETVDFYSDDIRPQWDPKCQSDRWDELVASAREHQKSGTLDELDKTKTDVGSALVGGALRLARARERLAARRQAPLR